MDKEFIFYERFKNAEIDKRWDVIADLCYFNSDVASQLLRFFTHSPDERPYIFRHILRSASEAEMFVLDGYATIEETQKVFHEIKDILIKDEKYEVVIENFGFCFSEEEKEDLINIMVGTLDIKLVRICLTHYCRLFTKDQLERIESVILMERLSNDQN